MAAATAPKPGRDRPANAGTGSFNRCAASRTIAGSMVCVSRWNATSSARSHSVFTMRGMPLEMAATAAVADGVNWTRGAGVGSAVLSAASALESAPAARSFSIISALPLVAARERGITP